MDMHVRVHSMGLELELEDYSTVYRMSVLWKKKVVLTSRLYSFLAREEGGGLWWKASLRSLHQNAAPLYTLF